MNKITEQQHGSLVDKIYSRLIASAPELFEILQEMERQFGGISAVTLNQKKAIKRAKDIINNLIYPNI